MKSVSFSGFTLVETLLVIGLSTVAMGTVFTVTWNVFEVGTSSERFQAAQLELIRAEERINLLIRNADSLEAVSETSITLGIADSSDEVVVSLNDQVIEVEQSGETVALTGDSVRVQSLDFSTYTLSDTAAQFIAYEILGGADEDMPHREVSVRGGAEMRVLFEP